MHSSSQIQDAKANLASLPTVSIENLQGMLEILQITPFDLVLLCVV